MKRPGQDSFTLTTDSEAAPSLADTKWWKLEGWTSLYCTPNSIGQGGKGKGSSRAVIIVVKLWEWKRV